MTKHPIAFVNNVPEMRTKKQDVVDIYPKIFYNGMTTSRHVRKNPLVEFCLCLFLNIINIRVTPGRYFIKVSLFYSYFY